MDNLKASWTRSRTANSSTTRTTDARARSAQCSGRMAAYTGKPVTWEEMMKSNETVGDEDPDLRGTRGRVADPCPRVR